VGLRDSTIRVTMKTRVPDMNDFVLRTDSPGVACLTLNRPDKLNALSVQLFSSLERQVELLETQGGSVGVVVVRGAGKCFSAGHDLADLLNGEVAPTATYQADIIERLANLPQPVIMAIHGFCYTGALELALAGDLILATDTAQFADTHAKWALTPIWGMSQRLPRRIGVSKAREMMLTCDAYSGAQMAAAGLVNFCVPESEFESRLRMLVASILANSSFTHSANKRLLNESDGMSLPAGLSYEIHRTAGTGPDMSERIAAFLNRKKPRPS
jgi:enoyl-CoA hydratase